MENIIDNNELTFNEKLQALQEQVEKIYLALRKLSEKVPTLNTEVPTLNTEVPTLSDDAPNLDHLVDGAPVLDDSFEGKPAFREIWENVKKRVNPSNVPAVGTIKEKIKRVPSKIGEVAYKTIDVPVEFLKRSSKRAIDWLEENQSDVKAGTYFGLVIIAELMFLYFMMIGLVAGLVFTPVIAWSLMAIYVAMVGLYAVAVSA